MHRPLYTQPAAKHRGAHTYTHLGRCKGTQMLRDCATCRLAERLNVPLLCSCSCGLPLGPVQLLVPHPTLLPRLALLLLLPLPPLLLQLTPPALLLQPLPPAPHGAV